eukprot:2014977-Ditylum_brightwellii.AAC.1
MGHCLLCQNQASDNDVIVEDVPEKWRPDGKSQYCLYFPKDKAKLSLKSRGPFLYLLIWYPTNEDMENRKWLKLTSEHEWNPYNQEDKNEICASMLTKWEIYTIEREFMYDNILRRVIKCVQIGSVTTRHRRDLQKEELACLWGSHWMQQKEP